MRTAEKTLIILAAAGLAAKELFFIAEGAVLFIVGLAALACVYLFGSWLIFRDRESGAQRLALAAPTGIVLAIACTGILFKLQLWPGSEISLLFSCITLVTLTIAAIFLRKSSPAENAGLSRFYRNILQRTIPFLTIVIALSFLSDTAYLKFHYRNDPEFAQLYIRWYEDPGNAEYKRALEDYVLRKYEPIPNEKP